MGPHRALMATFTASALLLAPAGAAAASPDEALAAVAYAGFRVVRAQSGTPETPQITLPEGYTPVVGSQYQVASRGEFYSFVQGEQSTGIRITVRWPGQRIAAVISADSRLALTPDPADPEAVSFTLPVTRASPTADSNTIQVWSYLTSSTATGEYWHVEHNDPDRAAGYWAGVTWPEKQAHAVISFMAASDAILNDAGLIAAAKAKGHFFALMGFETNNWLHLDNPPHWHLSYYPGSTTTSPGNTVPHYWVDALGHIFYNGQDVQGQGRTPYRANQPAPIYDGSGNLMVTTTIRDDGGLDIDPPTGSRYSITAPGGDFSGPLQVLRDGVQWRSVVTADDYRAGILRIDVRGYGHDPVRDRFEYRYDALTGKVLSSRRF